MTHTSRRTTAVLVVLLALAASLPASAHTTDWFTCFSPSPTTSGAPADWDCTLHMHWADKSDWLSLDYPAGTRFNHDENSAYPDGEDDPDDEQGVGQTHMQTNYIIDGCTDPDFSDGGSYVMTWEDTWTAYTPPAGWSKVAEYQTTVLLVNIPTHVIHNPVTGRYRIETDLPTTLTCSGAPTDMRIQIWSHENNNSASEWVIKNPPIPGSHTVAAIVGLTTGTTHSDSATITTT